MIPPPLSISARPALTGKVASSFIASDVTGGRVERLWDRPVGGRRGRIGAAGRLMNRMGTKSAPASPDRVLAEIATAQHGVVSVRQLASAGISARSVQRRVEAARLHRIHRGVYAVGHRRLTREGQWLAADPALR